jgi:fructooligosaccharide transport system substrate-binding protein
MKSVLKLFIAGLVVGSVFLAACSPQTTTTQPSPAAQAPVATQAASGKQPVTLSFIKIADDLESKAFAEILTGFQASEGGKWSYVNIQYNAKPFADLFPAIENSVATGQGADLIQADGPDVKHFAYNKVLKDLTASFTKDELAQWDPGSIAEGSYKGAFYGPPEVQSCQSLWYNQTMVDAAGLKLGTDGLTYGPNGTGLPVWQKLTVDKSGSGTPQVYGFQNNGPSWFDYLNRIPARTNGKPGDPTFEGVSSDGLKFKGYFDTPQAIQAYQFDQDLFSKYKVRSTEPPANAMLAGFSAMVVSQDLILGTLKDQFPNFKIGAMEPPYWVTPMCQTGSWHYAISTTSKHFDEALAWIKYASSDAGAAIMFKYKNQLPANVKLLASLPDFKTYPRSLTTQVFNKDGKPRIETPAYTEYNALFSEFYGSLVSGGNVTQLTQTYAQKMEDAAAKYAK